MEEKVFLKIIIILTKNIIIITTVSIFLTLAIAFYTFRDIYLLSYMKVTSQAKGFRDPFWIDKYRYFITSLSIVFHHLLHLEANWDVIFTFSCAA